MRSVVGDDWAIWRRNCQLTIFAMIGLGQAGTLNIGDPCP